MGDLKSHRAILSKGFLWLAFLATGLAIAVAPDWRVAILMSIAI
jgi:hypothetical protein